MSGALASPSPPPTSSASSVGSEESSSNSVLNIGNCSKESNRSSSNNSSSSNSVLNIGNCSKESNRSSSNNSSSINRSRSINRSSSSIRPHLRCGLCQEVYCEPRLLPACHHSFCLRCLEDWAGHPGHSDTFPCPTCYRSVHVPVEGVQALEKNFHIHEDDLELERAKSRKPMCDLHPEEILKLFCIKCQRSICTVCKMTQHEKADGHHTESLSDASRRCRGQLEASTKRLNKDVRESRELMARLQDKRQEACDKAQGIKDMIGGRYQDLVRRAAACHRQAETELDRVMTKLDQEQTTYISLVQLQLDDLIHQQQRLAHALDSTNDVEMVKMEREEREEREKLGERAVFKKGMETRHMPLFHDNTSALTDQILYAYFGHSCSVDLPASQTAEETLTLFYTCQDSGIGQAVHFLHKTLDGHVHILFGGQVSKFHFITLSEAYGGQLGTVPVESKPIFDRGKAIKPQAAHPMMQTPGVMTIFANSNKMWYLEHTLSSKKTTVICRQSLTKQIVYALDIFRKPIAMDVNRANTLLTVIEEDNKSSEVNADRVTTSSQLQNRCVRIYRIGRGGVTLFLNFYNGKPQLFHPTTVSFWQCQAKEVLLVADWATDTVHMLETSGTFVRHLAAGSPLLLRPTALDTRFSDVYIGCETGAVLRCEPHQEGGKREEERDDDASDGECVLQVENASGDNRATSNTGSLIIFD